MMKNQVLRIIFTDIGHFINDGIFFLFPLIVPFLTKKFDLTPIYAGTLFATFYGFSLLFTVFVSVHADISGKLGEGIFLGLSLMSISLLLLGIAYTLKNDYGIVLVFFSAAIMGIGSSYYHPLSASVLTHIVPEDKRGLHLGLNGAFGSTGRAIYPLLMTSIEAYSSFQVSMTSLFIIGILASIFILIELKNVKPPMNRTVREHLKINLNRALLMLAIITFLRSLFSQGISAWFPTFLVNDKSLGLGLLLGITMTTIYSIAIVGQPVFGILSDKMDKRILFFASTFGTGISVILFVITSSYISFIFMFLYAFFNFTSYPLLMSITRDYSAENSSFSNSLIWGVANTGGMVIGSFLPSLFVKVDYSNLGYIFTLLSIAIIIVSFLIILLPKVNRRTKMVYF